MKSDIIKELNTFLEGNYMAIHAYEKYIHQVNDSDIKQTLQNIQQNHKRHAAMIAERIQNLNGIPVDGVGIKGTMAVLVNKLKGSSNDPTFILRDALEGENKGIEISKKLVDGDLDPESLALVQKVLTYDQKHIKLLDELIAQKR
ncbi:DUF2383 domain-containing protein [Bacillus sp. FJAT-50079]|uniref:DUF2383 domain-containing protein n=1 Tax=Bacillus sp. FJAT-50079 TaxID=2833577 RepID=UPI001BC97C88|nr:DUF2383 domain-containing protein [Bacillus sp. FJAT-50079]MBS4207518.1 PA2169 family four-helix-bundle protein [Bacillus sp. FJAT-50079]